MLKKKEYFILLAVSLVLALAVLVHLGMDRTNRTLQSKLVERQNFIQQSLQLEGLYVEMIKAVAELSERTGDADLRKVLTNQGMTVQKALQTPAPDSASSSDALDNIEKPLEEKRSAE
jgi:predicted ArsR family transcriptional regulator